MDGDDGTAVVADEIISDKLTIAIATKIFEGGDEESESFQNFKKEQPQKILPEECEIGQIVREGESQSESGQTFQEGECKRNSSESEDKAKKFYSCEICKEIFQFLNEFLRHNSQTHGAQTNSTNSYSTTKSTTIIESMIPPEKLAIKEDNEEFLIVSYNQAIAKRAKIEVKKTNNDNEASNYMGLDLSEKKELENNDSKMILLAVADPLKSEEEIPGDGSPNPDLGSQKQQQQIKKEQLSPSSSPQSKQTIFPCSYCGEVFTIWWKWNNHVIKTHLTIPCNYSLCKQRFATAEQLHKHNTLRHRTCPICSKLFFDDNALKSHLRYTKAHPVS